MADSYRRALRKLLLATDFSADAEAALEQAVSLALHHGAALTLVHSVVPIASPAGLLPAPEALVQSYREAAQQHLEGLERRLGERLAEVSSRLLFGPPHRAILAAANELGADLLVLGTRGLSGLKHLLLGSTARRVIQHSTRPVLTVPPGGSKRHESVERVLIPTDFSSDARAATAALRMLTFAGSPSRILLLNVYYTPILYTAYGSVPTTSEYLQDFRGEALETLEVLAEELRGEGLEVATLAEEGSPAERIVRVAEEHDVGLIAMGTRGRSGLPHLLLGSTSEQVVPHAPCPVLTVNRAE